MKRRIIVIDAQTNEVLENFKTKHTKVEINGKAFVDKYGERLIELHFYGTSYKKIMPLYITKDINLTMSIV